MTFAFALLGGVAVAVLLLAATSAAISARIDRRHPPEGRLVPIPGGVMHVAERGPVRYAPLADIVLIHGASATLGDPMLALGDALAERYRVLAIDRPGQGWSTRPGGELDVSPSRQARHIAEALRCRGVKRAVILGHSYGAAVAAALAVEEPGLVQGIVFVAPATHPWPGGVDWHYRLAALPLIGRAFAFLLAPTLGSLMLAGGAASAFAPQKPPPDYLERSGAARALTPKRFRANGQDVASLKRHVVALSPRYREIDAPCAIISGDKDNTVWPSIHSKGLERDIRGAKLVMLEGIGHMPHHVRPDVVLAAVDEIVAAGSTSRGEVEKARGAALGAEGEAGALPTPGEGGDGAGE